MRTPIVLGGVAVALALSARRGSAANASLIVNGDDGTGVSVVPVYSPAIKRFAEAIATAEGFGVPGAIPTRAHNPGDLKLPASLSPLGYLAGHTIFATDEDGWQALYRQLQLIVDGRSRIYTLSMTIDEMGARYAPPDPQTWARNVARVLGVPTNVRLRTVLL